jgi:hypothetical protein
MSIGDAVWEAVYRVADKNSPEIDEIYDDIDFIVYDYAGWSLVGGVYKSLDLPHPHLGAFLMEIQK